MPKIAIRSRKMKGERGSRISYQPGEGAARDPEGYAKFLAKIAAIDAANAHKITEEDRIACEEAAADVERALSDPNPKTMVWRPDGLCFVVGLIFRDHRNAKGMTKAAVAKTTGVSPARIARIEKGGFRETDPDLPRIAKALGMDLRRYF